MLKVSPEHVLQSYGRWLVKYMVDHGYNRLLTALAPDIVSFIRTMNSLNVYLSVNKTRLQALDLRILQVRG